MPKPNRWRDFVKKWATDNNTTYACALSQPDCKDAYRRKYGVAKKLPQKRERELMGMEDINVARPRRRRVRRVRRRPQLIIEEQEQEQEQPEENEYPIPELVPFQNIIDENAKKQRFRESKERFGMTSEDLLSRHSQKAEKARQLEQSRIMGEEIPFPRKARQSFPHEPLEEAFPSASSVKKPMNIAVKKKSKKSKKPKPILVIQEEEVEEAPKKKRGRPRKYSSAEEAYEAKIAQNRGYKQEEARRVKALMKKNKEMEERERGLMGMEDINVARPKKAKKSKQQKERELMGAEDINVARPRIPQELLEEEFVITPVKKKTAKKETENKYLKTVTQKYELTEASKDVMKTIEKMKKKAKDPVSSSKPEVKWGVKQGDYWVIDGHKLEVGSVFPNHWDLLYISGTSEDFALPEAIAKQYGFPTGRVKNQKEVQRILIKKKWDTSKNFFEENTGPMPLPITLYTPKGMFYKQLRDKRK